jgi:hypothetical protein
MGVVYELWDEEDVEGLVDRDIEQRMLLVECCRSSQYRLSSSISMADRIHAPSHGTLIPTESSF